MTLPETASIAPATETNPAAESLKRKAVDAAATVIVEKDGDKRVRVDDTASERGSGLAVAAEDDEDAASVYPDSEEFYAWLVSGGDSGPFLACHRLKSCDEALPLCPKLVEMGVAAVYDPADDAEEAVAEDEKDANGNDVVAAKETKVNDKTDNKDKAVKELSEEEKKKEDEMDDMKEVVNFAIEDSYCILLQDFVPTDACVDEPAEAKVLRNSIATYAESKTWAKVTVSREADAACSVPVTVMVFDVRKGHIVPKIGCWKFVVGVEAVTADVDKGMKLMMENYC
ncbi:hypothetical protein BC830DRAFT_1088083 [Chytriomyces sp. MP71]|nr:hypothetical protein BC830DRAFT_1088083 [Chytriomyces sp. MP71]